MPKQIIHPAGLSDPSPTRAYSHGIRTGSLLFLAGQTGHDAATAGSGSRFEALTRRAFERMQLILEAAGGTLEAHQSGSEPLGATRTGCRMQLPAPSLTGAGETYTPALVDHAIWVPAGDQRGAEL